MGVLDSVRQQVLTSAKNAMVEAEANSYSSALNNLNSFYAQGDPQIYKRTYKLGSSPRSTGVQGSDCHLRATIYLDTTYPYETGSYSASEVISEAESGGSGILGKPHFWQKTEEDIENALNTAIKKHFT